MRMFKIPLFIFALAGLLMSQLNTSLYLNQAYESNPFRYPDARESWISTLDGNISFSFDSFTLGYIGSYTGFSNFSERNYYWHQAALTASIKNTRLGVYYDQRFNRGDYTFYNYRAFTGYINHSLSVDSFHLYFAASGIINNYAEISDINNFELNGTMRLNRSFETRTTVIAGAGWHFKKYTTNYTYNDTASTGMGSGMGQNNTGGTHTLIQTVELDAPSVSQFVYWLRIAQSISPSTGAAIQYRARIGLTGTSRYISGLQYGYSEESELFDDPMGYELHSLGLELTQILPEQIIVKASAYRGNKDYTTQGIYTDPETYDESVLRLDKYHTIQAGISKNFSFGQSRLQLQFWYTWTDNESNSYWYNYRNNYSSISLNLSF
jgi:hypothetical protein